MKTMTSHCKDRRSLTGYVSRSRQDYVQLERWLSGYKEKLYRDKCDDAELLIFKTMIKASQMGGFAYDWTALPSKMTQQINNSCLLDIFLRALKGLALVRIVQHQLRDALQILQHLKRIDPDNSVNFSEIEGLLKCL